MTLRKRKGFYKGCYYDMDTKWGDCGETMTVKEACDHWWNSIRIDDGKGNLLVCYKNAYTCDPAYQCEGEPMTRKQLSRKITLANEYDYDSDGYPIVYATFAN